MGNVRVLERDNATASGSGLKSGKRKNPRTGEAIKIARRKAPKLSAGKGLANGVMRAKQTKVVGTKIFAIETSSTQGDRGNIREAFLKRSYQALERMVAAAASEDLVEALAAPTDIGGMARLLSNVGVLQPECVVLDPWAEFLAKGAVMKQELLREAGGAYTTGQVAELLGITRQAVQQRVRRGTLLALDGGAAERYYPATQFDKTGVIAGLEEVLAAFTVADPWTRLSVLLDTDESLGGKRVIDALRAGKLEQVLRVVRSFGS